MTLPAHSHSVAEPATIFVSYSHHNEAEVELLLTHLAAVRRAGHLEV